MENYCSYGGLCSKHFTCTYSCSLVVSVSPAAKMIDLLSVQSISTPQTEPELYLREDTDGPMVSDRSKYNLPVCLSYRRSH